MQCIPHLMKSVIQIIVFYNMFSKKCKKLICQFLKLHPLYKCLCSNCLSPEFVIIIIIFFELQLNK